MVCDWLVVVAGGSLAYTGPVAGLGSRAADALVVGAGRECRDELDRLVRGLGRDPEIDDERAGTLRVLLEPGEDPSRLAVDVNLAAHRAGIVLHELHHARADLEARFLSLVESANPVSLGGGR
jgi:ABC-2 type transport system ATP-binding protein